MQGSQSSIFITSMFIFFEPSWTGSGHSGRARCVDVRDLECCVRDGAIVGFHRANIHTDGRIVDFSNIETLFGVAASQM